MHCPHMPPLPGGFAVACRVFLLLSSTISGSVLSFIHLTSMWVPLAGLSALEGLHAPPEDDAEAQARSNEQALLAEVEEEERNKQVGSHPPGWLFFWVLWAIILSLANIGHS